MEQLMCARGYSNHVAGFASSSLMIAAILSSVPIGLIVSKLKKELQASKILLAISALASGSFSYLVTEPGHTAVLITLCVMMGVLTR